MELTSGLHPQGPGRTGLAQRRRRLRRRRQSRRLRTALSTAAWLVVSLMGMGCLAGAILIWAT